MSKVVCEVLCWRFSLYNALQLGRPVEVDSNQIEKLIENNQCDTMGERADKISKLIKLLVKMKCVSYFKEKTIQAFWLTQ